MKHLILMIIWSISLWSDAVSVESPIRTISAWQFKLDDPATRALLEHAREGKNLGLLQDAIMDYVQAIEANRHDVLYAAPALKELWSCCQELPDSKDFDELNRLLISRLFFHPPAHDGKSEIVITDASDALLWHDLSTVNVEGKTEFRIPVVSSKVDRCDYNNSDGTTGSVLVSLYSQLAPGQFMVGSNFRYPFGDGIVGSATVFTKEGKEFRAKSVSADQTANTLAIRLYLPLEFGDRPLSISSISGTLKLSQPTAYAVHRIPLQEGSKCSMQGRTAWIDSLSTQDSVIDMTLRIGKMANESSGSGAMYNGAALSLIWIEGDDGRPLIPTSLYSSIESGVEGSTWKYGFKMGDAVNENFPKTKTATHLACLDIGSVSTREVQFIVDDVNAVSAQLADIVTQRSAPSP